MTPSGDPLACALFLITALSAAGLLHSAWLRLPLSRRLAIPLDAGAHIRGRRVFGENKTVRGFVVMVPAAALTFALFESILRAAGVVNEALWPIKSGEYALLGALAGLGFMLGELPNSFVKRQLGIAPGEGPRHPVGAVVAFVADRWDSIVGMLIAVSLAQPTSPLVWVYVLLIGPPVHWAFSVLLYRLGVKARPA